RVAGERVAVAREALLVFALRAGRASRLPGAAVPLEAISAEAALHVEAAEDLASAAVGHRRLTGALIRLRPNRHVILNVAVQASAANLGSRRASADLAVSSL